MVISIPSSDSSPKSVYEAMFCGKPVVISDLEWSYELLNEVECVCRVDPKNIYQISESIIRLITDTKFSDLIKKNALLIAHKYFDYEINMTKMERIMLELVKKRYSMPSIKADPNETSYLS